MIKTNTRLNSILKKGTLSVWLMHQFLQRQEQPARWMYSHRCSCVNSAMYPNMDCPLCKGTGFIFKYPDTTLSFIKIALVFNKRTIIVEDTVHEITKIKNLTLQKEILCEEITHKEGKSYITLKESIELSSKLVVYYTKEHVFSYTGRITVDDYRCEVPLPQYSEIVEIESIKIFPKKYTDLTKTVAYFKNFIVFEDMIFNKIKTSEVEINVKYRIPIGLSVYATRGRDDWDSPSVGEARVAVPHTLDLSENDLITVYSANQIKKLVMVSSDKSSKDYIPVFDIEKVVNITDAQNNLYEDGKDFIQIGRDSIKWIRKNKPKRYSILLRHLITYSVINDTWALRNTDEGELPRNYSLQIYDRLSSTIPQENN